MLVVFYSIMQLVEHGLLTKLDATYLDWLKSTSCGEEKPNEAKPLHLDDFWASFIILPFGLAVALLMLLWERTGIHG